MKCAHASPEDSRKQEERWNERAKLSMRLGYILISQILVVQDCLKNKGNTKELSSLITSVHLSLIIYRRRERDSGKEGSSERRLPTAKEQAGGRFRVPCPPL